MFTPQDFKSMAILQYYDERVKSAIFYQVPSDPIRKYLPIVDKTRTSCYSVFVVDFGLLFGQKKMTRFEH